MDKAVVLILLVASVGCIEIGIEETATPEDVLINFFELYGAKDFRGATELCLYFEPGSFAMSLYTPLENITINNSKCNNSLAIISFTEEIDGNKIERHASMYRLDEWKILNIGKDRERLKEDAISVVTNEIAPLENSKKFELSFFDRAVDNSSVVLLEEVHYSQEMIDLEFEFVKYLNEKGYRDVVLEMGYSSRYLIQKYLATGDEAYYKLLFDEGNFIKKIYEYNKELPEDKKVIVWGIDVDQSLSLMNGFYMIDEYIQNISDEKLKNDLSEIYWGDSSIDEFYWGYSSLLNPDPWISALETIKNGCKDKMITDIADSMISSLKINPCGDRREKREEKMKENFDKICEEIAEDREIKIVAILGSEHARKSSQEARLRYERIDYYLSSECPETKDRVYSICLNPLSGGTYDHQLYSNTLRSMQLSKLERALVDSDLIIVDPENTYNEKNYDIMMYIRKISPAIRSW